MLEKAKEKILMKWQAWDKQLFKTRDRNLEPHSFKSIMIKVPNLGKLTFKRRIYQEKLTGKWVFLLDKKIKLEERKNWTLKVRKLVKGLVLKKMSYTNIREWLNEEYQVDVSEGAMTLIMRTLSRQEEKVKGVSSPNLHLCTDEGFITVKVKGKPTKVRGRITSVATGKVQVGKRNKLINKKYYLSLHREGENVDNQSYWQKLKYEVNKDYVLSDEVNLFWGTDGAGNLKTLSKVSGALQIYSKFHWQGRIADLPKSIRRKLKWEHREVLKNWNHPNQLGYWSESDIAHILKGYLSKGKVWSLQNYQNILRQQGVRFI